MTELSQKHCAPCEGGTQPLSRPDAEKYAAQLGPWEISEDGGKITRVFRFKNYYQTMAFVNAVAWIAHQEDHHPDMEVAYSRCTIHFSTHAIGGLSENDFICAAKVDALQSE